MFAPTTPAEFTECLRSHPMAHPVGAGTKPALSRPVAESPLVSFQAWRGITEYQPAEFTFTARAGTPLREIASTLATHGQYLPWDPPLIEAGATIGGTVAAGLNGPGRLRYGGMRDFIIGTTFLSRDGRLLKGGGKVVKNAAGFDYPKLLVGSCGALGLMLDLTFKVFPAPECRLTAKQSCPSLGEALALAAQLSRTAHEPEAVEISSSGEIHLRLAGDHGTLTTRLARLNSDLHASFDVLPEAEAQIFWERKLSALPVKVPIIPSQALSLAAALRPLDASLSFSVAANVALIEWPSDRDSSPLHAALLSLSLAGQALVGSQSRLGLWPPTANESLLQKLFCGQ